MVTPIKPSDVVSRPMPDVVLTACNELILKNFKRDYSVVFQSELIERILELDKTITKKDLFDCGWLDIEPLYRKVGWKVKFKNPKLDGGSYPPYFEFEF
jgi:hypothetical protein